MSHRKLFLRKRPQRDPKNIFFGSGLSVFFLKARIFSFPKTFFWDKLSIEIIYKKRTYDARLGEISSDSYGKSYSTR